MSPERLAGLIARLRVTVRHLINITVNTITYTSFPGRIDAAVTNWLEPIRRRVEALMTRVAAGDIPPERPKRPPQYGPWPPRGPRPTVWPEWQRRRFGWVVATLPRPYDHAARLESLGFAAWLDEPDLQALIVQAPRAFARLLRPCCWALRVKPPACLPPLRPPRPRIPRPPDPEAPFRRPFSKRIQRLIAWPGLNRPPHLHGPIGPEHRAEYEAWMNRHDPMRWANPRKPPGPLWPRYKYDPIKNE